MKKIVMFLMMVVVGFFAYSQKIGSIINPQMGFTLSTLNLADMPDNQPILFLFLPNSENFSPNINLVTQEYAGKMENYKEITDEQLNTAGITVIQSKIDREKYILEYETMNSNVLLHVYTVAKSNNSRVFLVTGTSTREQWKKYNNEIIRVVNSLELTN